MRSQTVDGTRSPKDVFGECHALHEGDRGEVHPVCHIPHSIDAGDRALVELIHLDLPLGTHLHSNLQLTRMFSVVLSLLHTRTAQSVSARV